MATQNHIPTPSAAQEVLVKVTELKTTPQVATSNQYLQLGWTLLATSKRRDAGDEWVEFVLGWANGGKSAHPDEKNEF